MTWNWRHGKICELDSTPAVVVVGRYEQDSLKVSHRYPTQSFVGSDIVNSRILQTTRRSWTTGSDLLKRRTVACGASESSILSSHALSDLVNPAQAPRQAQPRRRRISDWQATTHCMSVGSYLSGTSVPVTVHKVIRIRPAHVTSRSKIQTMPPEASSISGACIA